MERPPVIQVRGLRNRFGAQTVHDQLDLDVYAGEVLGIVGGSGTGKSVLLRTIVGLNEPDAGQIHVLGTDMRRAAPEARAGVRRQIGVAFQDGALFSSLSVLQNVMAPMRTHLALGERLMAELSKFKVNLVGLPTSSYHKYPSELSGGMRKRAALARALALDPQVVFLDEPTAGLDPIGAAAYDDLVLRLQASLGLTVFMVTHDLDSLYAICNRVAVLAERRVYASGPIEEMAQVDHLWIQEYFGGPRARAAQKGRAH